MAVKLADIPGAFHLPRPNWDAIRGWVEEHIPERDRPEGWDAIAVQWLDLLNDALRGAYRTHRSTRLLLLAPRGHPHAETLLQVAESGITRIVAALGRLASERWLGPLVLLMFADQETYYLYASPFNPEHRSGGMCLREGYTHIALPAAPLEAMQRGLYHELTHACLGHLYLPPWLEEGITQLAEEDADLHRGLSVLDAPTIQNIRSYWLTHGLQAFWWGEAFSFSDEGQGHSYRLAKILFQFLLTDHRSQLPDFVSHAHADDAGDSAARKYLGKGVGELAGQFLGPGSWEPIPPDAAGYCRRGVLHATHGKYDAALADYDEAIRLDPELPETYTNRGWIHAQLGAYALAIADYEKAIQLNPRDSHPHNNLAWILATCPEEAYRDSLQALEHAHKACELCDYNLWYCLGTLAAAHAEAGDFEEARTIAKESMRQAPEDEQAGCRARLSLYREGKPYRDVPASKMEATSRS